MEKRNRICLDVSGHLFKINKDVIKHGPASGLSRLLMSRQAVNLSVIEIDRPADTFGAILAWYQTGELHIPATSCPRAFLNEMEFWEISPEALSSCCNNRLHAFLSEQDTLLNFGRSSSDDDAYWCRCLESIRSKIWSVVEYSRPSIPGKLYFITTLIMIMLSIFTLACSTDHRFQRDITNCERLEYMESANMEDYDLVKKKLADSCDDSAIPKMIADPFRMNRLLANNNDDVGVTFDDAFDNNFDDNFDDNFAIDSKENGDFVSVAFELGQTPAPLLSPDYIDQSTTTATTNSSDQILAINLTTFSDPLPQMIAPIYKYVKIPNMKVPLYVFIVLEIITAFYFTIDISLRLFSCPHIGRYFLSVINVTDAAAIVFTYAHYIWSFIHIHEQYDNNMIDLLKIFQMLRSLRLFRIVSNVKAGRVLAYSLRANLHDLFVLFLFLLCGVCLFSSCLFIVDRGKSVSSIPEGWYWAVVTMTTVGYGDIVPQTPLGRVVATICMIFGVLLFAVTVPIFANNFLTLYQYADAEHHIMKSLAKKKISTSNVPSVDREKSPDGIPCQV